MIAIKLNGVCVVTYVAVSDSRFMATVKKVPLLGTGITTWEAKAAHRRAEKLASSLCKTYPFVPPGVIKAMVDEGRDIRMLGEMNDAASRLAQGVPEKFKWNFKREDDPGFEAKKVHEYFRQKYVADTLSRNPEAIVNILLQVRDTIMANIPAGADEIPILTGNIARYLFLESDDAKHVESVKSAVRRVIKESAWWFFRDENAARLVARHPEQTSAVLISCSYRLMPFDYPDIRGAFEDSPHYAGQDLAELGKLIYEKHILLQKINPFTFGMVMDEFGANPGLTTRKIIAFCLASNGNESAWREESPVLRALFSENGEKTLQGLEWLTKEAGIKDGFGFQLKWYGLGCVLTNDVIGEAFLKRPRMTAKKLRELQEFSMGGDGWIDSHMASKVSNGLEEITISHYRWLDLVKVAIFDGKTMRDELREFLNTKKDARTCFGKNIELVFAQEIEARRNEWRMPCLGMSGSPC